jgi:putative oxidoreductase
MGWFAALEDIMNIWFLLAALGNFAVAVLHIYIIYKGENAYRFFGAGEQMAQAAAEGSVVPALVTSGIAVVFAVWGLYALVGAGLTLGLPWVQTVLWLIAGIYTLRGVGVVMVFQIKANKKFWIITSAVSLLLGGLHFLGISRL